MREELGDMISTKLRLLVGLGAAVIAAGCGASGDDMDQFGTVEQAAGSAPAGSNALYVPGSSVIDTAYFPGERRFVAITMQNTGASSPANDWTTNPNLWQLSSPDGTWGWAWVAVPQPTPIGSPATFGMIITAPLTAQPFSFQMRAGFTFLFGPKTNLTPTISNTVTPFFGCSLVTGSSNIPLTMTPGESRGVTITVRNSGSQTWAASGYSLNSFDNPVNFWGQTNANLTTAVAPGNNATFNISIKAPTTPGTYPFVREMRSSAIGEFRRTQRCIETTITVAGAQALNAGIVSADFPTMMNAGDIAPVSVVMQNTGTESWLAGGNYVLFSQNSPSNLWGVTQPAVTATTATGQNATINFNVTAPATPGTYHQKWQMRKMSGAGANFFGALIDVTVTVGSGAANLNAAVASQTIPNPMTAGKAYTFAITMQNTGTTSWSGTDFALYSTNTPANVWGVVQQNLGASETIAAGESRLFNLAVVAPSTPGTYASSWRMRRFSTGFFGATALTSNIVVTLCGNSTIDAGEQCDDGNLTNGDLCSNTCQFEQTVVDPGTGTSSRTLKGSGQSQSAGTVTLGDVTGDGRPEVFTSQLNPPAGITGRSAGGAVYGLAGGASFLNNSTTVNPTGATLSIAGADANDLLGASNTGRMVVGEVTGDAIGDLIVSAQGADGPMNGRSGCGEVYVLTGSASLISAGLIDLAASPAPSQLKAHITGAVAGQGLLALGVAELTGDSQPDLVLGAPGTASVYVIGGGASLAGEIDLNAPPGGVTIRTISVPGGGAVAGFGDFNNDGSGDIVLGAPGVAVAGKTRAGVAYGRVGPITSNIDLGLAVGSATGPSVQWLGKNAFDGFGQSAAIGNVTGTAASEVLIGSIQFQRPSSTTQSGAITIWSGVTPGTTFDLTTATPTSIIQGADANDDCGTALGLGDANGDGFLDVIFACSAADGPANGRFNSGEVNVVLGSATMPAVRDLLTAPSSLIMYGAAVNNVIGRNQTLMSVGDIDADGKADFCAGSTVDSTGAGRVDCVKSPF
jgi:cysteine-rich repeat protein